MTSIGVELDPELTLFEAELRRTLALPDSGTKLDALQFKLRLEDFRRNVLQKAKVEFQRAIVADLVIGLQRGNPVGDKKTWKVNIARAKRGLPAVPFDYKGGKSKKAWTVTVNGVPRSNPYATLASAKSGDFLGVRNNEPYMEALNRGWSKQAPPGWINAVIQSVTAKYARVE